MTAPHRAMLVKRDLDDLIRSVLEAGIADDVNHPFVRCNGDFWEVSFPGAAHISVLLGETDYAEAYRKLNEQRSYSVKFCDGGILQLMYRFDGEQLVQHRLAFFPSPGLNSFQSDPDGYMSDEIYIEIISRRIIPFPLRFDFDCRKGVYRDIWHPKSHLTLGDVEGCRMPVTKPLTPRWFFEFIIRNFYQTERYDFVGKLPNHKLHFETSISENERSLIHLVVPPME